MVFNYPYQTAAHIYGSSMIDFLNEVTEFEFITNDHSNIYMYMKINIWTSK